jgi:hypothetical protein
LVQKSLKTDLRLKSYEGLKLHGLDCKFAGASFKFLFKTRGGLDLNLQRSQGALMKNSPDLTDEKEMAVDGALVPWTGGRAVVYGP